MKHHIDVVDCYISEGEIVTSDGDVYEFSSPEDFPEGESFSLNTNCQFIIKHNQKIYYIEFDSQSIYDEDWEDEEPNRREFDLIFHFELKEELTIGDIETNNLKFENINDEEFISRFCDEISEDIIPLCGDDLLEEKPFVEFIMTSNEKDNVIKEYHENGNIKEETEVNSKGFRHGLKKIYHENGQLQVQVEFTNGKQNDGEIISFHDNGNKARCVNLSDGNYEGDFIEWHKNGVISRKGVYENDEIVEEQLWDEDKNPIDKKNEVIEQHKITENNMNFSVQLVGIKNQDFQYLDLENLNKDLESKLYEFQEKHEEFLMKREHESQGITQEDIDNETDEFIQSFGLLEILYEDIEDYLDTNIDLGFSDDKKPISKESFEYYVKNLCLRTDGLLIVRDYRSLLDWPNFISKYINPLDPEYLDENFQEISFDEFMDKSLEIKSKYGCSLSSLVYYTNE